MKGQEFIEINPIETLSYEKLNELKRTIEAVEQRLDKFQNRGFTKIKQMVIPDLTPRLVILGRYLLLLPDEIVNSLKLISYDSSIQTLLYTKAIKDIQGLTMDTTILWDSRGEYLQTTNDF